MDSSRILCSYFSTHLFHHSVLAGLLNAGAFVKVSICAVCGDVFQFCHVWFIDFIRDNNNKGKNGIKEACNRKNRNDPEREVWQSLCIWQVVVRHNGCSPHRTMFYQPAVPKQQNNPPPSALLGFLSLRFHLFRHLPSLSFLPCFSSVCQSHHLLSLYSHLSSPDCVSCSSPLPPISCFFSPFHQQPDRCNQSLANPQLAGQSDWHYTLVKCSQCTHALDYQWLQECIVVNKVILMSHHIVTITDNTILAHSQKQRGKYKID